MIKKRYLFLIIFVCFFTISAISAEEISNETNDIYSVENYVCSNEQIQQDNILTISDDGVISDSNNEWYVNASAIGISDGSKNSAYKDLKSVLDNNLLKNGDIIYIASGVYVGNNNTGLTINNNLNIIKWGEGNVVFNGFGKNNIFKIKSNEIYIDGLTFMNGYSNLSGGALSFLNRVSSCRINGIFIDNIANGAGGAIYFSDEVSDCVINGTFQGNHAEFGGALFFDYVVSNCNINGMFIDNYVAQSGGAIGFSNNISNSKIMGNFIRNTAVFSGGVIFCTLISNCNILGNFTNNSAEKNGGVVYSHYIVSNCNVDGAFRNNGANKGGVFYFSEQLSDCNIKGIFTNNFAKDNGGVFYSEGLFFNSDINGSFISNTATNGGALYFRNSFLNSNIGGLYENNIAKDYGGAIRFTTISKSNVTALFNFNSATSGGAIYSMVIVSSNIFSNFSYNSATNGSSINAEGSVYKNNITSNFYHNSAHNGGALYFPLLFTENSVGGTFINNSATKGGVILFMDEVSYTNINGSFINNFARDGGVIYCKHSVLNSAICGEFINNTAKEQGGVILLLKNIKKTIFKGNFINNSAYYSSTILFGDDADNINIEGTFINNSAYMGAAFLFFKKLSNSALKGKFINNSATDSLIYIYKASNSYINNSIFLKNNYPLIFDVRYGSLDANNNWYGNNATLFNKKPSVSENVNCNSWLFLNATADYLINEKSNVVFNLNNLYNYSSDKITHPSISNLPECYFNLSVINGNISKYCVSSGENVIFTSSSSDKMYITAKCEDASYTIKINKWSIILDVPDVTKFYNGSECLEITLTEGSSPIVNVPVNININGTIYTRTTNTKGKASVSINLNSGTYEAIVTYQDIFTTAKITINPLSTKTSLSVTKTSYNAVRLITSVNPTTASGKVTFNVNGEKYFCSLNDAKAILELNNLDSGSYNVKANYGGDTNYKSSTSNTISFNIEEINFNIYAPDVTKYFGGFERFVVTITDKTNNPIPNANVKVNINGVEYARTTGATGQTSIALGIPAGNYSALVEYEGIKIKSNIIIKPTVSANDITKIFRNGTQYYAQFVDTNGNVLKNIPVEFNINGIFYKRTTNDQGIAKMNINLNPGEYIITATNPISGEMHSNIVTVLPNIVDNHDLTKFYRNDSQYVIKLLDDRGNPVGAGVTMKFNINGVFYTRTSNATGHVKMNINLAPGRYIITAEYNNYKTSNVINVLPVLEAKDLNMKYRDGSKFEVKLVDGQGKAFAGQKITFNINGVFYDRTTDASGIARLTINLMAGEYIITSMYGDGAAISNKVTIRS